MAVKYLNKKVAKWTFDVSTAVALYDGYTFDAADINEAADTITISNHPYKTGDLVSPQLTATTGVTATAPAISTAYYVINIDKDTIALATSLANAQAGTKTALTAGSAADVFLTKENFGVVKSGLVIPSGAIVTNVVIDVDTTFVSADGQGKAGGNVDAATLGLGLVGITAGAEDLVVGIAISNAGNYWDAGRHGTLVGSPALGANGSLGDTALELAAITSATYLNLAADAELTLNIGVDPLWAGKMNVYVEYMS